MAEYQQLNEREGATSALNAAIETLNLKISGISPATAVFGSVVTLLTLIEVCFLDPL